MYCIGKEEIELERCVDTLYSWVAETFDKNDDTNGREYLRSLKGNAKVFVEEAYPIAIFAKEYFAEFPNVRICLCVGNQNYDAIVKNDSHTQIIEYLEVTQAVDGNYEKIRMKELKEKGSVSGCKGFKNSNLPEGKRICFSDMAESHNGRIETLKSHIKNCVIKKNSKHYPKGTALLVAFDDSLFFSDLEIEILQKYLNDEVLPMLDKFQLFSLVGTTKHTILFYPVGCHV